jgi:hypothetical protein
VGGIAVTATTAWQRQQRQRRRRTLFWANSAKTREDRRSGSWNGEERPQGRSHRSHLWKKQGTVKKTLRKGNQWNYFEEQEQLREEWEDNKRKFDGIQQKQYMKTLKDSN